MCEEFIIWSMYTFDDLVQHTTYFFIYFLNVNIAETIWECKLALHFFERDFQENTKKSTPGSIFYHKIESGGLKCQ